MLIKNVFIREQEQVQDLRCSSRIEAIGRLSPEPGEAVLDAGGGEALPGLHDHHIHLMALARQRESIDLGNALSLAHVADQLAAHPGRGWIRCVHYHETTLGELDRHQLDELESVRPLRVQHASGKMWVLNSAAIESTELDHCPLAGVERDGSGKPTGRLFRMDAWLRDRLGDDLPDLPALGQELAGYGITSVTDASYTNTHSAVEQIRKGMPQKVYAMGDASLISGNLKVMLDEDRLPDLDELSGAIASAHAADRGVAFHCVSHVELVFALAALDAAGPHSRDRIEHAAVVRPDVLDSLKNSGCTVVTQPGFLLDRGDRYLREADAADLPYLYPYARLLAAGIPVAASSDAPYGPANPWQVMASAVTRRTAGGAVVGEAERVDADEALRGYLSSPDDPGGAARTLHPGAAADLVILAAPWSAYLAAPGETRIRATLIDGSCVYSSPPST